MIFSPKPKQIKLFTMRRKVKNCHFLYDYKIVNINNKEEEGNFNNLPHLIEDNQN